MSKQADLQANEWDPDQKAIAQLVHQHGQCFVNENFDAMAALFDKDYPKLTYKPTEADDYLTSFEQIVDNFGLYKTIIAFTQWEISKLFVDIISPDVAFAICNVDTQYTMKDSVPREALPPYHYPKGKWLGSCRYVFHRINNEWKIIHYEDSTNESFRPGQLYQFQASIVAEIEEKLAMLKPPAPPE